jgi:hypothetical protein
MVPVLKELLPAKPLLTLSLTPSKLKLALAPEKVPLSDAVPFALKETKYGVFVSVMLPAMAPDPLVDAMPPLLLLLAVPVFDTWPVMVVTKGKIGLVTLPRLLCAWPLADSPNALLDADD